METSRISHAAIGWLIALALISSVAAQDVEPDSANQANEILGDSLSILRPVPESDSGSLAADTIIGGSLVIDTAAAPPLTVSSGAPSIYEKRLLISKGPSDEVKSSPGIFVLNPGPVGMPAIPVEYLNTPGPDISVNGLPFYYNGIYRPYVIGTDLNVIPWEILRDISSNSRYGSGLDFSLGPPSGNENRSDVEIARGPYNYNSSRWRFFRPFGEKTYAYFTVGFRESDGYLADSDHNSNTVTGGISRRFGDDKLSIDIWRHRSRTGVNSFDYYAVQESRQSRGINRYELRYNTSLGTPVNFAVTGLYHRSAQTIRGYNKEAKSKFDISGGQLLLSDSAGTYYWTITGEFFRRTIYGLSGIIPKINEVNTSAKIIRFSGIIDYEIQLKYQYDDISGVDILPYAYMSRRIGSRLMLFLSLVNERYKPDAQLIFDNFYSLSSILPNKYEISRFDDDSIELAIPGILNLYRFMPNSKLKSPLLEQVSGGINLTISGINTEIGVKAKKIQSQITISYSADSAGNFILTPVNFDDRYTEIYGKLWGSAGPLNFELNGTYRKWSDRYFDDGLEKGPQGLGYARIAFEKEVFIPRLYLGGTLEARFASRRDYRSITTGYTDAFANLNGRLEFRYKDFTFWLTEENLANASYITWWPYYEQPRSIIWGLRWEFFD